MSSYDAFSVGNVSGSYTSNYDPTEVDSSRASLSFQETKLYEDWEMRTGARDANDFLIVISPSSRTSGSGSGKTTLGTTLGKAFDRSESGFDGETQATLDAGRLAYKILPEIEHGSAVVFDEAQGAPGTKSVNARRGMTAEALDAITAILANRDKALTIIIIVQQLGMLDSLIYPMIDSWMLIRRDPQQVNGPLVTNHTLTMNDYDLNNPDIKTPAHEDLTWADLPDDDPDYAALEAKKQDAKRRRSNEEDDKPVSIDDLPKPVRNEKIRDMAEVGIKQDQIAQTFGLKQPTISRIINDD